MDLLVELAVDLIFVNTIYSGNDAAVCSRWRRNLKRKRKTEVGVIVVILLPFDTSKLSDTSASGVKMNLSKLEGFSDHLTHPHRARVIRVLTTEIQVCDMNSATYLNEIISNRRLFFKINNIC